MLEQAAAWRDWASALGQGARLLAVVLPLTLAIGGPLGVLLHQLPPGVPARTRRCARLAAALHTLCSTPLIVLMAALIPVSCALADDATLPLLLAAIPYFARLVAFSLHSVPPGLVDAAQAMGASPLQIVRRVLLVEARSELVLAVTLLTVSLLAYAAVAGGALWVLVTTYAQHSVALGLAGASIVTLVALIGLVQLAGQHLARRLDRRR